MDGFTWDGYARLEYLWVAAESRREGVGRQLVEAAIDEALGFVEVGHTTDTPLGYDEIVYQMRLDGHPE
jgi:GNAT superfamily N-acetyltransferase